MIKTLTDTEYEVFLLIALDMPNKRIAAQRGVSVRTIETHRERVMRKLDIHSAVGLAHFALFTGCIRNPCGVAAKLEETR